MATLFFEDLVPGSVAEHGPWTVTADEIVAFAREYDPQPFHLGEDSAKDTFVGRLIASGWHTIAIEMRMLCDSFLLEAAGMGSPGVEEVKWLRPVLPGDELTLRRTVLGAEPSRSRPEMGVVRFRLDTLNGRGEIVMSHVGPILFARREPDGTPSPARERGAAPGQRDAFEALVPPSHGKSQIGRPFDEIELGATDMLGEHGFTADEIVRFAAAFDPQPFHVDEGAAQASQFGGLIASGWHTAATWMRHLVRMREAALGQAQSEGRSPPRFGPSPGFKDLRWLKPVRPGDTIRYATTATDKRRSASRPGWGLVFNHNTGWNQHGDKVFEFSGSAFVGLD